MLKKNIILIKAALKLDIYDLNYNYTSKRLDLLNGDPIDLPKRGILIRLGSLFRRLFISAIYFKTIKKSIKKNVSLMGISNTQNQKIICDIVLNNFDDSFHFELSNVKDTNFPLLQSLIYSLLFIPYVFLLMLKSKGYIRRSFSYAFDSFVMTYGFYIISRKLFQIYRPSLVLVTNDHIFWTRTFCKAALDEGIETIYIQHATVRDTFPPLCFNYSLLDGYDALKKYSLAGKSDSMIFLVGSVKLDKYILHKKNIKTINVIGFSNNTIDPLGKIENNIIEVKQNFVNIEIIIRPHPSDPRFKDFIELSYKYGLTFSNPKKESSFSFLKRVDMLISSDSGIILEAIIMNIYTIYFNYNRDYFDMYKFLRNGIVKYVVTDAKELINFIREKFDNNEDIYKRARYYCATVGTQYEGYSTELIKELLVDIIESGSPNISKWERIKDVELTAYQIANNQK